MALPSPLPLKNPPITEAILDVQLALSPKTDVERLKKLGEALQREYPQVRPQFMAMVNFQVQPVPAPPQPAINQGLRGYNFLSADSKEVVQFRLDGFTFNRLAPYTSWEDMFGKAESAWHYFRDAFPNEKVTRVAARYLNRILLSLEGGQTEIDDYFSLGTKDPHDPSLQFLNFVSHQFFIDVKTGFGANINVAMQPFENDRLPVILDIDVFDQRPDSLSGAEPFSILTEMREVKNRLFLKALTPKALELFQ